MKVFEEFKEWKVVDYPTIILAPDNARYMPYMSMKEIKKDGG